MTYTRLENCLKSFHLQGIFDITWRDEVTNSIVLQQAGSLNMHLLFCQCWLYLLGHVHHEKNIIRCYVWQADHKPMSNRPPNISNISASATRNLQILTKSGGNSLWWVCNQQTEDRRQCRRQTQAFNPHSSFVCNTYERDHYVRIWLVSYFIRFSLYLSQSNTFT